MQSFASQDRDLVDRLLPQVRTVMEVQAAIRQPEQSGALAQFQGRLTMPSEQAYEQLQPVFEREGVTLLLREREGTHYVIAVSQLPKPGPSRVWINLVLFVATLASVLWTGIVHAEGYLQLGPGLSTAEVLRRTLPLGLLFTVSLLAILVSHEFGHYLMGRYHKSPVSLPYFLPLPAPFSYFGTLGAFIQLKAPPKNRRTLLDIGVAGPLAGMLFAVPVILVGLALSQVTTLPTSTAAARGFVQEGNSVLYLAAKYLVKGQLLPAPTSYNGVSPLMYWLRYIVTGAPAPLGGQDVLLHPLAWAGWIGFLVTGLNLIPVGQLDGGHTAYSLLGERARALWLPFVLVLAAFSLLVFPGWLLFVGLLFFFGRVYATPLDDITGLDPPRKAVAIAALVLFVLIFTPVPLYSLVGP